MYVYANNWKISWLDDGLQNVCHCNLECPNLFGTRTLHICLIELTYMGP